MKFLHLGDLHLGKDLCNFDLYEDQEYILRQILDIAKGERVNAILIAGDVYDKSVPSEKATRLLDHFLSDIAMAGIQVYMISGNHDSDDRLNFGRAFFEAGNVNISSVFDGGLTKKTVSDEYGELDIYLLPFVKASQVRYYYPKEEIFTYHDAVRTVIKNAAVDSTRRNILVAHQYVAGKDAAPVFGGSESIKVENIGTVERIGCECFEDFDYVALGHIHSAQSVGRESIRYAGSPLKYSLKEIYNNKSVPIITVNEKGSVKVDLIPLKPLRDLRHIKGTMSSLLALENVTSTDDFIYVTLTDPDIIPDAMGIFRNTYSNTVKLDYDNEHTRAIEAVEISRLADDRPFDDLISDFYRMIYGSEITSEELDYMRTAAREAGVLNETN